MTNLTAEDAFGLTFHRTAGTVDGRKWAVYSDGIHSHVVSLAHWLDSGFADVTDDEVRDAGRFAQWNAAADQWADDLTAREAAHNAGLCVVHSADGTCASLDCDTFGLCRAICDAHWGDTLDSPEFQIDANRVNWDGCWPVVDGDGEITGEITEGGDGWLFVRCEGGDGMIEESVARDAGWEIEDTVAKRPAPAVPPVRWIETAEDADAFLAGHRYVRLAYRRKRGGWVATIAAVDGTTYQTSVCPMPHTPMARKALERTLAHRYLATVTDDGATVNLRWARALPNWAGTLGALPELARAIEAAEREAATTVKS